VESRRFPYEEYLFILYPKAYENLTYENGKPRTVDRFDVSKFPGINGNKAMMKGGIEMTKMKVLTCILSTIFMLVPLASPVGQVGMAAAQEKSDLPTLQKAVICERVENQVPRGIRQIYPSSVGTLWCFTKLADIPSEGTIYHIWYHGNKEMAKVELSISPPQWRTYSSKIILPSWKGSWKVEVVHGDYVLKTVAFAVQ
jgi:hypothetical protein